jgi:hypothetical protein
MQETRKHRNSWIYKNKFVEHQHTICDPVQHWKSAITRTIASGWKLKMLRARSATQHSENKEVRHTCASAELRFF